MSGPVRENAKCILLPRSSPLKVKSDPILHDQSNVLNIGDPRKTPTVEHKGL